MIPSHLKILGTQDIPATKSRRLVNQETNRVKAAIAEGRLRLFFQPAVRSDSMGFVAFYEGLARIIMPDGTIISAGQFIPFVENTPVGRILDRKTLEMALLALHADEGLRLSVNLSPNSMSDQGWLDVFHTYAKGVGDRLILEVTETAAISNIEHTAAFLRHIRSFGCSIALDDFGTGYTSFRHFRDFLFDIVKIDGLFIRDLDHNKDNQVLLEALLKISQHFDMMTVAEFVETPAEARKAAEMGVDCLQGFLIGRATETPQQPTYVQNMDDKLMG